MSHIDILRKAQILQGLSTAQLEVLLETNQLVTYQRGQVIFEENSQGREMYIVMEGEVAAEVDPAKLGTIERGSTELRPDPQGEHQYESDHDRPTAPLALEGPGFVALGTGAVDPVVILGMVVVIGEAGRLGFALGVDPGEAGIFGAEELRAA